LSSPAATPESAFENDVVYDDAEEEIVPATTTASSSFFTRRFRPRPVSEIRKDNENEVEQEEEAGAAAPTAEEEESDETTVRRRPFFRPRARPSPSVAAVESTTSESGEALSVETTEADEEEEATESTPARRRPNFRPRPRPTPVETSDEESDTDEVRPASRASLFNARRRFRPRLLSNPNPSDQIKSEASDDQEASENEEVQEDEETNETETDSGKPDRRQRPFGLRRPRPTSFLATLRGRTTTEEPTTTPPPTTTTVTITTTTTTTTTTPTPIETTTQAVTVDLQEETTEQQQEFYDEDVDITLTTEASRRPQDQPRTTVQDESRPTTFRITQRGRQPSEQQSPTSPTIFEPFSTAPGPVLNPRTNAAGSIPSRSSTSRFQATTRARQPLTQPTSPTLEDQSTSPVNEADENSQEDNVVADAAPVRANFRRTRPRIVNNQIPDERRKFASSARRRVPSANQRRRQQPFQRVQEPVTEAAAVTIPRRPTETDQTLSLDIQQETTRAIEPTASTFAIPSGPTSTIIQDGTTLTIPFVPRVTTPQRILVTQDPNVVVTTFSPTPSSFRTTPFPTQTVPRTSFTPTRSSSSFRAQPEFIPLELVELKPVEVDEIQEAHPAEPVTRVIPTPSAFENTVRDLPRKFSASKPSKNHSKSRVGVVDRYRTENDDGSITWGYKSADGSFKEETIGADCITRGR
jgi:hypothetical protein